MSCHLQRLPFRRIQRSHEVSEINFQEDPAAASLRSRNQPALCTRADFLRMHMQESGGFFERERPQQKRTER
jgi:hypothetical protein